ncbi:MAG: hypothetical protein HQM12_23635 [SAR324 cluster bacterium]|nr:hypothetical protein [SAR324 cluster bacterium]MBF0353567.1 hypothetical protein [SAR324 cluster bacterium]
MKVYDEVIDFIATGTTPGSIIAFQPSPEVKERVFELIQKEKTAGISEDEKTELEHYMHLEHLMRLIKAKAYQHVSYEKLHS